MVRLTVTTFLSLMAFVGSSRADVIPQEVDVYADALFVPIGFDDNDEVTVVLDGYLPDPCHRLVTPYVDVDRLYRRIIVGARARKFGGICPQVVVPFTQEVRIGLLPKGIFNLLSKDGHLVEKLPVKRSPRSTPDDYFYAPVDGIRVEYPAHEQWTAVLEGRFTNNCMILDEIRVNLTGKTIQVLPIMRLMTHDECGRESREEKAFEARVSLPFLKNEGRHLLHVRSLNGQAHNKVFYRTPIIP